MEITTSPKNEKKKRRFMKKDDQPRAYSTNLG